MIDMNCTGVIDQNARSTNFFISPIPKFIHRIWMVFDVNKPEMSARYKEADRILKCLHPDWIFMEWDDNKVLNFVYANYPNFFTKYISYSDPVMRHDVARYLILDHYGGVFIQHSFVFQKNIVTLLGEKELIFSERLDHIKLNLPERKGQINNNFIASVPQHKFWNFFIKELEDIKYNPQSSVDKVMSLTGPFILTDSLKKYQDMYNDKSIFVLPTRYLMPFFYLEKEIPEIKENCVNNQNLTKCFDVFPESYAYTSWDSFWSQQREQTKAKVNLSALSLENKPLYDKLYIINLKRSPDRWAKIAYNFFLNDIPFERFQGVNGYDTTINMNFKGIDIKRKLYQLGFEDFYHVACDNGLNRPLNISLQAKFSVLMAANIGLWCTQALLREEIKRNNFQNTIILEDDFELNFNNFTYHVNKFIRGLPENYSIAYLDNYVKNRTPLKTINNIAFKLERPNNWFGDWAHMLSLDGAAKLNLGYKFMGNSDEYSRELAMKIIKKEGVEDFTAYAAKYNFSLKSFSQYQGHNKNSLSTKMGCRTFHKSATSDCDDKMHIDQTYVAKVNDFKPEMLHENNKVVCNANAIYPIEFFYKSEINNINASVASNLALWCSNYKIWQDAKRKNYTISHY